MDNAGITSSADHRRHSFSLIAMARERFSPFARALGGRASAVFGDRLVSNLGWYGVAEFVSRFSRLLAAVILGRTMSAAEIGAAALAITCFELIRVLTNNGIGQMVIRSSPEALTATCNSARRAGMIACVAAFLLQLAVGLVVGLVTGRNDVAFMIVLLAGVYLIMIPGLVPVYLLMREARTKQLASVSVAQLSLDNVLTAILAFSGWGAWAIVLPKLLTAPVWLFGVRYYKTWTPDPSAGSIPLRSMAHFAGPILCSELLAAARLNLDKLLVWTMLGVEALGSYYFAFNAGIGLSLVLTTALSNSLYPELAQYARRPAEMLQRYDRVILKTALPIAAVILLQAALTSYYVPLVFGAKWYHASSLVALLCLSAVTKPFSDAGAQLLRASGLPTVELTSMIGLTIVTLTALWLGLGWGLAYGIAVFAAVSFMAQIAIATYARWSVAQLPLQTDHAAPNLVTT